MAVCIGPFTFLWFLFLVYFWVILSTGPAAPTTCSLTTCLNYLYVLPVWYKNRGGGLPVWYKTTLFRVTRLVLENSPASLAPVDKPYGGGRPGHRKKAPGTTFSGAETLEDARDSRGRIDILRGGRSFVVSKTPDFPALSSGFLWSGNNGGPPRRVGHQSRPLPLLVPPGDSRVSAPFFIAALNSPYSASAVPSWVRSAVSILLISCRNVRPCPVSFGGRGPHVEHRAVLSTVSFSAAIPAEFPGGTYSVLLGALALRRL